VKIGSGDRNPPWVHLVGCLMLLVVLCVALVQIVKSLLGAR